MRIVDGSLTERQIKILDYISNGKRCKDIARLMGCAPKTIQAHSDVIKATLHAETISHAVALAIRGNVLPGGES